jgi:hypothetical protein
MKEISSEVGMLASTDEVWEVLADFERYPEWNPLIRRIDGELCEGEELEVEVELPGGQRMVFHPTLLVVEPGRKLRWTGEMWWHGLVNGEHTFCIEPIGTGRVHLIQRDRFSGLLAPVLTPLVVRSTWEGLEAMNHALKERVDALPNPLLRAA